MAPKKMNDPLDEFARIARTASREAAPEVDVTDSVMRRVQLKQRSPEGLLEEFARLARLAVREVVPEVDVTDRVLRTVRLMQPSMERPLAFMAAGAAVAAILVAALVYPQVQEIMEPDPLDSIVEYASADFPF